MIELLKSILTIMSPGILISLLMFCAFYNDFIKVNIDHYENDSLVLIEEGDTYNIYANKNTDQECVQMKLRKHGDSLTTRLPEAMPFCEELNN